MIYMQKVWLRNLLVFWLICYLNRLLVRNAHLMVNWVLNSDNAFWVMLLGSFMGHAATMIPTIPFIKSLLTLHGIIIVLICQFRNFRIINDHGYGCVFDRLHILFFIVDPSRIMILRYNCHTLLIPLPGRMWAFVLYRVYFIE